MTTARVEAWARRIALRCVALGFVLAAGADAQLIRRGSEFQVNQNTYVQLYPSVASLQDGGFIVAWQNVTYIYVGDVLVRRFNAVGEANGPEFVLDTSGYGALAFRGRPTIASADDDRATIAWQHASSYALSIQGGLIDSAGSPLGAAFEINANTYSRQRGGPDLATMTDGAFIVVWDSFDQDGYRHGGFVRRFDAAGVPQMGDSWSHGTTSWSTTPTVPSSIRSSRDGSTRRDCR
jgi:hypothetical protein